MHTENGRGCHSYSSTTGGDAELDGVLKELALMLVVAVLVTDAVAVFEPLSVTLVVVEEVSAR